MWARWPQAAPPPPPPRLEVKLITPIQAPIAVPDLDVLEKNTLDKEAKEAPPVLTPPPTPTPTPANPKTPPKRLPAKQEQTALRKFSEYIIYPQAAVDAGREATVHLLLSLTPEGLITAASIAASSGHRDLDEAALAAIRQAGRINVGGKTEFILPVTFRLQ